jgi:hypothetical protein
MTHDKQDISASQAPYEDNVHAKTLKMSLQYLNVLKVQGLFLSDSGGERLMNVDTRTIVGR